MKHNTLNQSLIVSLLLLCSISHVATAPATEDEIADAQVKKTLANIKTQEEKHTDEATANTSIDVDLSKINSSSEQLPISFDAIESSINRLQQELDDLKVHLADIKEASITQAQDEKNMRARLKAELERKVVLLPAEGNESNMQEDTLEDDEDLEADEEDEDEDEQDVVEIIAKECEEA